MVHPFRRVRRSPNLQQEIIHDSASITGASGFEVGLTNKILEIAKEVGDIILRLIIIDLVGSNDTNAGSNILQCNLISKPKSEGVPVDADFDDAKYTVSSYAVAVDQASVVDKIHWRQNLSIKVPAGNDVYLSCRKFNQVTVTCAFYVRLFWQSL